MADQKWIAASAKPYALIREPFSIQILSTAMESGGGRWRP
jgi:hypothetical protein